MKRAIILFFSVVIVSGCMIEPYKLALDKDAGPYPENYMEILHDYLNYYLENPESLQNLTVIKPPEKKIIDVFQESISLAKGHEVWECFIAFDAKNRQGKTVRDFHVVWFRNARIVAFDYQKPALDYRLKRRINPVESSENPEKNAPETLREN